jgi:HSP20 family molecular chaperone IbpA
VEVTKMTQLMRYEPWWLTGLERQMDELFGALRGPSRSMTVPAETGRWMPTCDMLSRDGDLVVRLDLPGIDRRRTCR